MTLFFKNRTNYTYCISHTIFRGNLYNNGTTKQISGSWADVPKGYIAGSGEMVLKVESSKKIVAISKTGSGFGGSVWTRP